MNKVVTYALDSNDSSAKHELGTRWLNARDGKEYKYIQAEDADLADGDVVEYSDTSGSEVTNDRAGGSSVGRVPAGVAVCTITDGYYGWIQVKGIHTAVKTDGGVTAGQALVPHATADGQADSVTAGTTDAQVFGWALADDVGSVVTAMINL